VRLHSIKLSGFKSFADAAQFALPSQLCAVVGPNGCGKSNIMDAVRWVLGESRASELRGENMQDVIFNGTTQRKPASRASVELLFDNSDQRAAGPWGQFAEIAVRRVVTREGSSSYFLNNQPMRRRDVQDLFLGTGLGPRAYAIIGQGTISRIIESRPEEMRLFLEEAAGVSRYKERRRETAQRLAATGENLARVQDVLRELAGQLQRLQQQAEVAQQYQRLHALATLRQQQLWYVRRAQAQEELEQARVQGLQALNAQEARRSEMARHQADTEALHQAQQEADAAVQQAQMQSGQASADVARLHEQLRHVQGSRHKARQRLQQLDAQSAEWQQRRQEADAARAAAHEQAQQAQADAALLQAQVQEHMEHLPQCEDALHQAQQHEAHQRASAAQVQRQMEVLGAEQRALAQQRRQHQARAERLHQQSRALPLPDAARLAHVQAQLAQAREEGALRAAQLAQLQEDEQRQMDERRERQDAANHENAHHATLAARLHALQAVQEKLQADDALRPWLQKHGLENLAALWSRIAVEPGWESALEAALRERLAGVQVARLDTLAGFVRDAPAARLTFFSLPPTAEEMAAEAAEAPDATPLLTCVRLPATPEAQALRALLAHWLHGCMTATTLDAALARRTRLRAAESIYLPQGHSVSRHSVSFYAADSPQSGMLARAQEIDDLQKQVRAHALLADEARAALVRAEAACAHTAQALHGMRRQCDQTQSRVHELQLQAQQLAQQDAQARQQQAQLAEDLHEVQAQIEEMQAREAALEEQLHILDAQLARQQAQHALAQERLHGAQRQAAQAREQLRAIERQAQEADFACRSLHARCTELERTLQLAQQQALALAHERDHVVQELAQLEGSDGDDELQAALARQAACAAQLAQRRSACEELAAHLRAREAQRQQLEAALEPLRQRITECQLHEQKAQLHMEQHSALLEEAEADMAHLAQSLAELGRDAARPASLQTDIERLQRDIAALGAVNLAALQELQLAREREGFLSAQVQDLTQAMQTLEEAIGKIDMETRTLLTDTFESVNRHLADLFGQLFGGGHARLIVTGDEILHAGVQIMAQPPGKKNQTIQLLSGGEKALTAIALVFAIFQLNPAPFCLLDEVDAPLDDANTARYARLVARMSAATQFLFISHNKIAMEMAGQLIGVTMQEQGVSRIVAVDMQAALGMAG